MEQTVLGISTKKNQGSDLVFSVQEKKILRDLALEVAEIASMPEQEEKRKLWYALNSLKPIRPVIFCDPENGWNEIIPEQTLQCTSDLARFWEMHLRKEIFWGTRMGDDRVVEPVFNIPYTYEESDWGMHDVKSHGGHGGSYTWTAPLNDYASDLPKLRFPQITVDYKTTNDTAALANEIFGDVLQVKIKGTWWWTLGMTWTLITLRGLENFMLDFCLYPDELHKLMAFLRDGHLAKLDFLEKNNLLSLNNDGTYVGSGGFGYTNELPGNNFSGNVSTRHMWGFGESQETVSVSPEMFEEFIFPYQLPVLSRFGLNCYGCCEPLDMRWHIIKKIPNLRRLSVSPWADVEKMSEYLGKDYIFSRKPSPADVATANTNWNSIRSDLKKLVAQTKNNCLEIIMKDNHTIANDPRNVTEWCRIAKELVSR